MAIHHITRWDFARCCPNHHQLDVIIGVEEEWFANDAGNLLGVVAHHTSADYGYALLKRDEQGRFLVSDLKDHFHSGPDAHGRLLHAMAILDDREPSGCRADDLCVKVEPQVD